MFDQATWIWTKEEAADDEYADFITTYDGTLENVHIRLACESDYTLYVNGTVVSFGQYDDYPFDTVYDDVDLSAYASDATNELKITVWNEGFDSQTRIRDAAGLVFELLSGDRVVLSSGERIFSRKNPNYVPGEKNLISGQLGYTWHYDARPEWGEYAASREVPRETSYRPRPIERLVMEERMPFSVVECGSFRYTDGDHAGKRMQNAVLTKTGRLERNDGDDGVYLLVDLGLETEGYADFSFEVPCECHADYGFGEHLDDGRCRTYLVGAYAQYEAKAGKNDYLNTFRRFGCRYVQMFWQAPSVKVEYLGLRPATYPVTVQPFTTGNERRDAIYRVAVRTLRQCMHLHYEDCPWREQALYTLDSRNQMLCGYYAFQEKRFARASLELISEGVRPDGVLSLCFPAGTDVPIPSYTMAYFLQMDEYITHTGDTTLAAKRFDVLTRLMRTFSDRVRDNGLTPRFEEGTDRRYWNFYEWSSGLTGAIDAHSFEVDKEFDAPLNAYYSLGLQAFASICRALGKEAEAYRYAKMAEMTNRAIFTAFYDVDTHLFRTYEDSAQIHVLTNALCLLCGACDGADKEAVLSTVADNGAKAGHVPATLSMMGFRYDALLRESQDYIEVILNEIDTVWGKMLDAGATTFWETAGGSKDFGGAGSLCHGWSALPVYYYHVFTKRGV